MKCNHSQGGPEVSIATAIFWNEAGGHCDCCGSTSKTIWGELADGSGEALALYFVQWTVGAPAHLVNIDLVIGRWGEGADPAKRILVSLLYRPSRDGGSFMVIDGQGRRPDDRSICGRAMKRDEVIGTPLAEHVFGLVDALWMTEPHLEEVRAFNDKV